MPRNTGSAALQDTTMAKKKQSTWDKIAGYFTAKQKVKSHEGARKKHPASKAKKRARLLVFGPSGSKSR